MSIAHCTGCTGEVSWNKNKFPQECSLYIVRRVRESYHGIKQFPQNCPLHIVRDVRYGTARYGTVRYVAGDVS